MSSSQLIVPAEHLEVAGNMLERHDFRDMSAPGLLELTGIRQHGMATASGLNDYDYQCLSSLSLGHTPLQQVQTVNKIPIPAEILEHFKHIKCHCMMGLFPEIGRAWLTIDSEIYIWTYEQGRDVAYYDGLNHLIISVALIKPKKSVFISDVKYLLVLTTPIEIIVLGVTFGDTTKTISSPVRNMQSTATFEEMQLMNKPIFILGTDNVTMNVVKGSDNGRIFLGGRDGCLYEISYQAESTWFGQRCKKINHSQSIVSLMVPNFLKVFAENDPIIGISVDNSRHLLYVLTEKGSIEAWDMGQDYSMRRFAKLTQNEIAHSASNIIKTVDPSVFKPMKSICPLSIEDSPGLHLLGVTHCGVRCFFATTAINQSSVQRQQFQQTQPTGLQNTGPGGAPLEWNAQAVQTHDCNKPNGLYLLHVRLPPGYTPNTTTNKPKNVHGAHFSEGTTLLVSTPQQDQDMLWSISSAPFLHRTYLAESTAVLPLDGIVWSMAEVQDRSKAKLHSILRRAQKPKKIVLLTNHGVHIVALLKPVDILQQLLIAYHGPHHEAIKAFFQCQSEREACATCLLLACSDQYRGTELAVWAAQAFMLYGGEPCLQSQLMLNMQSNVGHMQTRQAMNASMPMGADSNSPAMFMSTPVANANTQAIPRSMQQSMYPLSPIGSPGAGPYMANTTAVADPSTVVFSAKHDGLYLYVSRLLRPIWKLRCVNRNLDSSLTQADCTLILEDLNAIKSFLDANSVNELSSSFTGSVRLYGNQTTMMSNGYGGVMQNNNLPVSTLNEQRNLSEQAQVEEKRSLTALSSLIKHTSEVVALWKILCEHQFQLLTRQLVKDQQDILGSCTFRDLVLSRADSCALLIVELINSYLRDNASVSSISAKLRDVCPNLYRHEDAVSFKATEILMTSKSCATPEEKNEKLRTALQLCKDAAPNLPLQNICQQFTLAGFYEGVIELAAACAAKIDTENAGIHFYNNDEPAEDRQGYAAFLSRMSCYKEIRLMLDHVYQSTCSTNANQEFPVVAVSDTTDGNAQIMQIVALAVHIKDPLLHVALYEWLMSHNMLSELLALVEPSLGEFLRRNVMRSPENLKLIDLLWKYYEKNGQHSEAARILDNLASTQSETIPLNQRIEYLARGVMCMRNDIVGYSVANGVLLKELEDKLDIARVQMAVLEAVTALAPTNRDAAKAVNELNYTLYDITQLYQNFADPFDLWECKLTILNCSNHNDPLLIESIWCAIINKAVDYTGSSMERCTRLFTKIESLVKEFGESGHCFPLAYLIRELEIKACQLRLPEGVVPDRLVAMNLDIELLLEYYSRMISMNERVWANEGNEWHLVQSAIRLVTLLANNAQTSWHRSKRRMLGKAQDIVSACLNHCYQKPGTEQMQQALKELQCRLQRNRN